jgi:predicted RNA binding protein YcfA (HicA-like mRNA interferase family)
MMPFDRLRNISTGQLVRALERDGFTYTRRKGAQRVYRHSDGRRVVIHHHRASDTFRRKTLGQIIEATGWTEADLRRLKLIS